MKTHVLGFVLLLISAIHVHGQVIIESNIDRGRNIKRGLYETKYSNRTFSVPVPSQQKIAQLLKEDSLHIGAKGYRFATATKVSVEFSESASWITKGDTSYGRLSLVAPGATTLSINFSSFFIPDIAELSIYNSVGTVAGPLTSKENNSSRTWGSPVFRGDSLWLEVKLPTKVKSTLSLRISNIAYGYRILETGKIFGFGTAGNCHNNVVCTPIGNNYTFERNGVCLILDGDGEVLCSGSMINNSCNNNVPYVLSANHCLTPAVGVGQWRFIFQYWSPNCTPSQDDLNYIQFYGATLRANASPSDFLLAQLNQVPDPSTGITYLGWDRTTSAATSGATLHHPSGDVMKITTFNTTASRQDNYIYPSPVNTDPVGSQHWIVAWNSGVTEGGSSGSPLLNQNRRIVGQLSGGPSYCNAPNPYLSDAYGRFDNSWSGLGTNATRLSNWLDPSSLGNTTTSSIGISHISGSNFVCTTASYSIANLQSGTTVTSWASSNPSILTINSSGSASRVGTGNGSVTITATLNNGCGNFTRTKTVFVGKPIVSSINVDSDVCTGESQVVIANLSGATSSSWAITSGNASNAYLTDYGNGQAYFNSYIPDCYGLQISVTNVCGSISDGTTICVNSCFGGLIAYPNPAKNVVTFDLSSFTESSMPDQILIFDEKSAIAKRTINVNSDLIKDKKIQINTQDLPRGIYFFHIIKNDSVGKKTEKIRIVLE